MTPVLIGRLSICWVVGPVTQLRSKEVLPFPTVASPRLGRSRRDSSGPPSVRRLTHLTHLVGHRWVSCHVWRGRLRRRCQCPCEGRQIDRKRHHLSCRCTDLYFPNPWVLSCSAHFGLQPLPVTPQDELTLIVAGGVLGAFAGFLQMSLGWPWVPVAAGDVTGEVGT